MPSVFAALDAMAATDLRATAGFGGWDRTGDAPYASWREQLLSAARDDPLDRTDGWRRKLARSSRGEQMLEIALSALVEVADACPAEERSLIHGDLINRNVLVEGEAITGIFDWGCSMYGDPLFDLAWMSFWAPWHRGLQEIDLVGRWRVRAAARGQPVVRFADRVRACHLAIGIQHLGYNAWTDRWDELDRLIDHLGVVVAE